MKPSNELQKIDTYGDPVHERHVYLLKQKKTADDDDDEWPVATLCEDRT